MATAKRSAGRRGDSPLSLRVTPEERRFLEARARETRHASVSAFVRARLFGMIRAGVGDLATDGRLSPVERQRLLVQILGALGASKALRHLSDLAEAARIGALPVTPDVGAEIRAACAAVIELRDLLLRALGARETRRGQDDC